MLLIVNRKEEVQKMNKSKNNNEKLNLHIKKNMKGVTLIALVVTMIVLLILAGVAINLTVGNNGYLQEHKMCQT